VEFRVSIILRVLGLIDLFTTTKPVWTAEELIEVQGTSRATTYRDLRALVRSGFLAPVTAGAYALGPRFIELDRQIRLGDPLLKIAPPVMAAQREKVGGIQLLCRYYGLRVMSVHEDRYDERIKTRFDRGRPFPLLTGSTCRVILANLSLDQQQRLFLHHAGEIAQAGLGDNWPAFKDRMRGIRERGVAVAGVIDKGLVGVAAPVFTALETVAAALTLVRIRKEVDHAAIERLSKLAIFSARKISERLQAVSAKEMV
jgi:DNA-binding IclR family transcriptional regulator